MELLEPVGRVGHEEVAHLLAGEVEDERAPLVVPALAGVGVLIERLTVELGQGPRVGREVAGHPVEDDANSVAVQVIHQQAELVGRAPTRRHGVVAGDVVAPRRHVGMLADGHELDVGEAEVLHVVDEVLGQLGVALALPPRPDVDLVDAHRPVVHVAFGAGGHPLVVAPLVVRLPDDRRLLGGHLGEPGHRVGLEPGDAVLTAHEVLVVHPLLRAGEEELPDTRGLQVAHGVGEPVPTVEVADDVDGGRVGRPHGEGHATDLAEGPGVGAHVRAEDRPELFVAALVEQVAVELAERRGEPVGVVLLVVDAIAVVDQQAVVLALLDGAGGARPDAALDVGEVQQSAVGEFGAHAGGHRPVARDRQTTRAQMVPKQVMRLRMPALQEGVDGAVVGYERGGRDGFHDGPSFGGKGTGVGGQGRGVCRPLTVGEQLADGGERDRHPTRAVAGFVDELVEGLVQDEGVQEFRVGGLAR
ncbi:MAG: hypothetical protein BWY91_02092 [bacterium ADurb.BinA028]|nr:MAG: hypothetical protein BWY91_02092 [bacterium ADurb.BinA028]